MNRLIIALLLLPVLITVIILFPMTRWKTIPWKSRSSGAEREDTNSATLTLTNGPALPHGASASGTN